MARRYALALVLVAAAPASGSVPSPEARITFPGFILPGPSLAVVDGKLTVTYGPVKPVRGKTSDVWYFEGTRIKSATGRGYLAYDPSGKDNRVFLAPRPGRDTEWRIRSWREGTGGEVLGWNSTFAPARGKLAHEDVELCLERARSGWVGGPAYRAVVGDGFYLASGWQNVK